MSVDVLQISILSQKYSRCKRAGAKGTAAKSINLHGFALMASRRFIAGNVYA